MKLSEKYCKIMCESCGRNATAGLIEGWNIALKDIPDNYLTKGFGILMQEKEDNYLSHPGELVKICRELQRQQKQKNRESNQTIDRLNYEKVVPFKEAVKKVIKNSDTGNIQKSVSSQKKLLLYRFDDHNFNIERAVCHDHVDFNHFIEECFREYRLKPVRYAHEYQKYEKIIKKDTDGKVRNVSNTHIRCQSHIEGAEKITVGYFYY
jgi:hypothetical protein